MLNSLKQHIRLRSRLRNLRKRFNYQRTIHINGRQIAIPHINGIACQLSEPWMTHLLELVLTQKTGAFIDVGVNLGQTLVKVQALDPQRPYVGFEPNPACVDYVQQLIKQNQFAHCLLVPVGLFTADTVLGLELISDEGTDSSASLITGFRPDHPVYARLLVPVAQFATVAPLLPDTPLAIIKIDVEGAELEVLTTLADRLKQDRPILLFEVLPTFSADNTFRLRRQQQLEQLLINSNYALFRVKKSTAGQYAGLTPITTIGIHADLTQCDYVALPQEQLNNFSF